MDIDGNIINAATRIRAKRGYNLIVEADIIMYRMNSGFFRPRDNKTVYILAHEMLHAFGFAHVPSGTIMNENNSLFDDNVGVACVDDEQVYNWKKAVNDKGGFYERGNYEPTFFDVE